MITKRRTCQADSGWSHTEIKLEVLHLTKAEQDGNIAFFNDIEFRRDNGVRRKLYYHLPPGDARPGVSESELSPSGFFPTRNIVPLSCSPEGGQSPTATHWLGTSQIENSAHRILIQI